MRLLLIALISLLHTILSPCVAWASVETHAHLFMKEGLGWMVDGNMEAGVTARNWSDRFTVMMYD